MGYRLDRDTSAQVSKIVAAAMEKAGETQLGLAGKSKLLTQGLLSNLMTGRQCWNRMQLQDVAAVLGVREIDLVPPGAFPTNETVEDLAMSALERKLERSRSDYLERHARDLSQTDREFVQSIRFKLRPDAPLDDKWWDGLVRIYREQRDSSSPRGGGKKPTP